VTLTTDLERAVAQRESMEAEVLPLRHELEEAQTELRDAKEAMLGQEEQLRVAQAASASLEERLRQQAERLEQARAEQARLTELEALVEGYRQLIEGGGRGARRSPLLDPSDGLEPPAGPSTASELAAVIEVAEQAVKSIMESTRVRADEELRAVDGERELIRRDVETMTAWRDRAAPMIASLQAAM